MIEIEESSSEEEAQTRNIEGIISKSIERIEDIRGNLGSKMGLIRKRAKINFCELEFKNQ